MYGNTATVEWAPVGAGVTGDVAFIGRGCPAGSVAPGQPADPILNSPAGKIALIDRGGCSVSLKVDYAVDAGAIGVLIGLVAPGDAVSFSFGGGDSFAPTLVIQQSLSNAIKARLNAAADGQRVDLAGGGDPAGRQHGQHVLARTFESCRPSSPRSARRVRRCRRKWARATARRAFGGTSGAAPMVSGAAALLLQAFPNRTPMQIKSMLMNSAETQVFTNPALLPGGLAPITRIGAGELRVDKAIGLNAIAWNPEYGVRGAVLRPGRGAVRRRRAGQEGAGARTSATRAATTASSRSFRYADDAASGAVTVHRAGIGARRAEGQDGVPGDAADQGQQAADLDAERRTAGRQRRRAERSGVRRLHHADLGQREAVVAVARAAAQGVGHGRRSDREDQARAARSSCSTSVSRPATSTCSR